MSQHGFASGQEHNMILNINDSIVFELSYNEETLENYPFKFKLRTKYDLVDENIIIGFEVENIDDIDMIFSLGSHPSFLCPFKIEEELEDYYLEFNKVETASILAINKEDFLTGEEKEYLLVCRT